MSESATEKPFAPGGLDPIYLRYWRYQPDFQSAVETAWDKKTAFRFETYLSNLASNQSLTSEQVKDVRDQPPRCAYAYSYSDDRDATRTRVIVAEESQNSSALYIVSLLLDAQAALHDNPASVSNTDKADLVDALCWFTGKKGSGTPPQMVKPGQEQSDSYIEERRKWQLTGEKMGRELDEVLKNQREYRSPTDEEEGSEGESDAEGIPSTGLQSEDGQVPVIELNRKQDQDRERGGHGDEKDGTGQDDDMQDATTSIKPISSFQLEISVANPDPNHDHDQESIDQPEAGANPDEASEGEGAGEAGYTSDVPSHSGCHSRGGFFDKLKRLGPRSRSRGSAHSGASGSGFGSGSASGPKSRKLSWFSRSGSRGD